MRNRYTFPFSYAIPQLGRIHEVTMDPIKYDLVNEVIRVSQTNLLENQPGERAVLEWIQKNAASYREHYNKSLEGFSNQELCGMLKELSGSGKILDDVLTNVPAFPNK
jgi:hypothetical protein